MVTIISKPNGMSYAAILAKAREKVSLKNLGIQDTVVRRALNGAIVIELPDPQGKQLANSLSTSLAAALGEDAKVLNLVATGELRFRGIDPSTTEEEIYMELEDISGCRRQDLKVSPITNMRDGMGVAWVVCPLEIAVKIAQVGVIKLGWTRVRAELMRKRPVQCFKCWQFGHLRNSCRNDKDRTGNCFRCGLDGHVVRACNAGAAGCVIYEDSGFNSRHRIGSAVCLSSQGFPSGV